MLCDFSFLFPKKTLMTNANQNKGFTENLGYLQGSCGTPKSTLARETGDPLKDSQLVLLGYFGLGLPLFTVCILRGTLLPSEFLGPCISSFLKFISLLSPQEKSLHSKETAKQHNGKE